MNTTQLSKQKNNDLLRELRELFFANFAIKVFSNRQLEPKSEPAEPYRPTASRVASRGGKFAAKIRSCAAFRLYGVR